MNIEDLERRVSALESNAMPREIIVTVLRVLQKDPHQWSTRPCSTCQSISQLVNEPFGCNQFAKERGSK